MWATSGPGMTGEIVIIVGWIVAMVMMMGSIKA